MLLKKTKNYCIGPSTIRTSMSGEYLKLLLLLQLSFLVHPISRKDFSCYAPGLPAPEWKVVGHRGQQNHDALKAPVLAFKELETGALAKVKGFEFIWDDRFGTNIKDASLWRPSCPTGRYGPRPLKSTG